MHSPDTARRNLFGCSIPILNHTVAGDAVYDPFSGSGTAIIAAERVGRDRHTMEIDLKYVQAAFLRWQAFTGHNAVRRASQPEGGEMSGTPRRRRGRGGQGGTEPRPARTRELRTMELTVLGQLSYFAVKKSTGPAAGFSVRQGKPGASKRVQSRPDKGSEPPHLESSLGLMEVTT